MARTLPPPGCQVSLYTHDLSSGAWSAEDVWVYSDTRLGAHLAISELAAHFEVGGLAQGGGHALPEVGVWR